MRGPDKKTTSDACASCSISTFLPKNFGRLRKRTPVNTAMYSTFFGLKEEMIFIRKPMSFQKTPFSRLKIYVLLPNLLKKTIFGPIVCFKSSTCGLPNLLTPQIWFMRAINASADSFRIMCKVRRGGKNFNLSAEKILSDFSVDREEKQKQLKDAANHTSSSV